MIPPAASAVIVCDQWLGSNGYAGMKALRRAGWAVDVVPEREFIPLRWRSGAGRVQGRFVRALGIREFNQELLRSVSRLEPEFMLAFKGTFVLASTLRELRDQGVRSYCFFPDVSFRAHGKLIPEALREYDWIFTTKSFGLRDLREQLGVTRTSLLLHAYDPDVHRPATADLDDESKYECDVSFIGTWSPKKEKVLAALCKLRPNLRVRIWGEQWNRASDPLLGSAIVGHEVTGEEYARAIRASSINLAILSERRQGASDGDQITSRTFHIPACGAFMMHERTAELLELFKDGWSVASYGDIDELVTGIDHYIANPALRSAVAGRGRQAVITAHSWDHRINAILAHHSAHRA
ncbi:MAG: glycosyltransferase [Anaerolineae bacterium]|nr:glycosyltransferase [Gemmatimonadaceae bacterium]